MARVARDESINPREDVRATAGGNDRPRGRSDAV